MEPKTKNRTTAEGFHVSPLFFYALQYSDVAIEEEEIRKNDLTLDVQGELQWCVNNNTLINWRCTGLPGLGKSTVALQLTMDGNAYLNKRMKLAYIARDQTEFSRLVKNNPEWNNLFLEVDEWNELENTGFNSTTEKSFLDYFSDIQAQRFLHRIACSPQDDIDKNSYLTFHIISADKIAKKTRALVYYKMTRGSSTFQQLIGFADIDVAPVLKTKWYHTYIKRKFAKMDLVTKEGVRSPKELEYAQLILDLTERLKPVAKLGMHDANTIKLAFRRAAVEKKLFFSIIGERDIIESVQALLKSIHKIQLLTRKIKEVTKQYAKSANPHTLDDIGILEQHLKEVQDLHVDTIEYWRKLIKINDEYQRIDEEIQ